jgi:hypothetical protein
VGKDPGGISLRLPSGMPPKKKQRTIEPSSEAVVLLSNNGSHSALLGELADEPALHDGVVNIGTHSIPVVKMLLAMSSSYFRAAFTSSFQEGGSGIVKLDSESLSPEAVKNLLHVAGTLPCQFSVPIALLPDTLRAAHQLQFTALIGPLANALCENLDFETALPTWTLFEHLSLKRPQLEEYIEGMRFVLHASLRIFLLFMCCTQKTLAQFRKPKGFWVSSFATSVRLCKKTIFE